MISATNHVKEYIATNEFDLPPEFDAVRISKMLTLWFQSCKTLVTKLFDGIIDLCKLLVI